VTLPRKVNQAGAEEADGAVDPGSGTPAAAA
jgi:hypothetical protein